jgi:hypothetical protein
MYWNKINYQNWNQKISFKKKKKEEQANTKKNFPTIKKKRREINIFIIS